MPVQVTGHYINRRTSPTEQLVAIAPTSTTCSHAPFPSECATSSEAVSPLISSFTKYNVTTAGEQAALISWMAFESADFKYNINHYPGTPGQGTRCMMSPTYVKEYAMSLSELSSKAATATTPAEILDLVLGNEYSFGSAAWFLSSQCSDSVKNGLAGGTDEGWEAFITDCIQTTVTDERKEYWDRAKSALQV